MRGRAETAKLVLWAGPLERGQSLRLARAVLFIAVTALLVCVLCGGCGQPGAESGSSIPATSESGEGISSSSTGSPSTLTSEAEAPTVIDKVSKIVLVAPAGPMAIPLAYLVVNNRLAEVADETELAIWENADQLKARVAGGQGDFITMPSNNAAIFYNKGLKLKLLNIAVWNITYLVTRDPQADSFADIKGQSLVVSLKGSVPDVMFQFLAKKEGLDPAKDFALRYVSDPPQASQLLLAGEVDNAVLSEALATAVVLQSKSQERPLRKAFAFNEAWTKATSGEEETPIAGTVVSGPLMDRDDVIQVFEREYQAALEWMLANPEEAGSLVENELPQLGLKAAVLTAAMKGITWKYRSAAEARPYLEQFYTRLAELSPQVIGGKLPDDGFYFAR